MANILEWIIKVASAVPTTYGEYKKVSEDGFISLKDMEDILNTALTSLGLPPDRIGVEIANGDFKIVFKKVVPPEVEEELKKKGLAK